MAKDLLMPDTIEAAISRVPQWSGVAHTHYELIERGLTNRSYRVLVGGQEFALRINAPDSAALGLDRYHEREVLIAAGRAGIGPELIYCSPEEGLLVTRWIDGTPWSRADMDREENVVRLAARLHDIHALPRTCKVFDPVRNIRSYAALARDAGIALPPHARELERRTERIADQLEATHLCHSDVVYSNIIDDGSLRIVDWEYAAVGDPLFDVATVARYHRFSAPKADKLLEWYVGGVTASHRKRFARIQTVFDTLHLFWLLAKKATLPPRAEIDERIDALLRYLENPP